MWPAPRETYKVTLTEAGRAYGHAIAEVITLQNHALALRVTPQQLRAADAVLRAVIDDDALRAWARTIPAPKPPGRPG